MAMYEYDVVIIGGGPGGYVCAIKAAQLGLKVACVEKRGVLGGTCLNEGCIPSKALLHSSYLYYEAQNNFSEHGINVQNIDCDLKKMMSRKAKVVNDLGKGIEYLFKINGVKKIVGSGRIANPHEVLIQDSDIVEQSISARNIVIATGSNNMTLPNINVDEEYILSSRGVLNLTDVPERMAIIGGGVIGVEMASIWNRLGSEVMVIDCGDRIIPSMDIESSVTMHKLLMKQGIKFSLSTNVTEVKKEFDKVVIKYAETQLEVDKVLISVGRKPNTNNLGIELKKDRFGFLTVNHKFETSVPGVFAIGDVVLGPMLAHKAEEEGVALAENLVGQHGHVGYIPSVVYTHPEVASVGYTEQEVREMNIVHKIGRFPFSANSRARAIGDSDGFVKIIVDENDTIIGAHIVGTQAGSLIAELTLAMEYGASAEDVSRVCHSHPDLNEAVKEAAMAAHSRAIHSA